MFGAESGGLVNLATARERDAPAAYGSREEGPKLKSFRKQEQSKCRTIFAYNIHGNKSSAADSLWSSKQFGYIWLTWCRSAIWDQNSRQGF
jgi:hypothetical protein